MGLHGQRFTRSGDLKFESQGGMEKSGVDAVGLIEVKANLFKGRQLRSHLRLDNLTS